MNRIITFLIIGLVAASCSNSDSDPIPPDNKEGIPIDPAPTEEVALLPKTIRIEARETAVYQIEYKGDSGQIDKITVNNGESEAFIYNNGLIEKKEYINNDPNWNGFKKYDYSNKVLQEEVSYRNNEPIEKVGYTFKVDNRLEMINSKFREGVWKQSDTAINLKFDSKGNLALGEGTVDIEEDGEILGVGAARFDVEYNTTHTPFLYVDGISQINYLTGIFMGDNPGWDEIFGRRNNLTRSSFVVRDKGEVIMETIIVYTYEYSDARNKKFPTKITGTEQGEVLFTALITYK